MPPTIWPSICSGQKVISHHWHVKNVKSSVSVTHLSKCHQMATIWRVDEFIRTAMSIVHTSYFPYYTTMVYAKLNKDARGDQTATWILSFIKKLIVPIRYVLWQRMQRQIHQHSPPHNKKRAVTHETWSWWDRNRSGINAWTPSVTIAEIYQIIQNVQSKGEEGPLRFNSIAS